MAEHFASEMFRAELYKHYRHELYRHASIGLQPISWKVLGLGDRPNARPIEVLIREQVEATVKFWQAVDALPRLMRNADRHAVYASAGGRCAEQARHYGMLVCRAFFKITSVSALVPDKVAGLQDVVELIEHFITG